MAACEMCGANGELVSAIIEGTQFKVCNACSSFGKIVKEAENVHKPAFREVHEKDLKEEVEFVTYRCGAMVKEAREALGMSQEELAKKMNERESVVHAIESGHLKPSIELARKLEKSLQIRLVENYAKEQEKPKVNFKNEGLTIGDLIKLKQKEKP